MKKHARFVRAALSAALILALAGCGQGTASGAGTGGQTAGQSGAAAKETSDPDRYVLISDIEYYNDGSVLSGDRYDYDGNGNKIRDTDVNSGAYTTYEYDGNGNRTLSVRTEDGVVTRRGEYTYNDSGDATLYLDYSFDYSQADSAYLESRRETEYTYGADGLPDASTAVFYNHDGVQNGQWDLVYDDQGRWISKTETYVNGSAVTTREFDSSGNLTKRTTDTDYGDTRAVETWQYDANGNKTRYDTQNFYIEDDGSAEDTGSTYETYEYDEDNRLLLTRHEGDYVTESREYDENGNLYRIYNSDNQGSVYPDHYGYEEFVYVRLSDYLSQNGGAAG